MHGVAAALMALVYAARFGTRCAGAVPNGDAGMQSSATWAEAVAPALVVCTALQCLMLAATAAVRLRGSTRVACTASLDLYLVCGAAVATILPCVILSVEVGAQTAVCSCGFAWAVCDLVRSVLCVASVCYRCCLDRAPPIVFPGDRGDARVGQRSSSTSGRTAASLSDSAEAEAAVTDRDEEAVDADAEMERPPRLSCWAADQTETAEGAEAAR